MAFAISAGCAGLGGALLALSTGVVNTGEFPLTLSIQLLAAMVLGGTGTLMGMVWGGILLVYLPQWSTSVSSDFNLGSGASAYLATIIFGVVLIVAMIAAPNGIQGAACAGCGATGRTRARAGAARRHLCRFRRATRARQHPTKGGTMPRRARRRIGGARWARALLAGSMGLMLGVTLLPATAGAQSTPGVTSSSITIGATVPLTGPAAPGYDEIAPAMNAVFGYVNAHGGVYGRKISYTYLDDGYNPANTATLTRKLVLQNNIFADVGPLGTPTQSAVQGFLNAQKVPQLFIESGCNCWSNPKYPYSLGWQPPYTVDGKILGAYIKANFAGKKIGYLYQADEFGQDVVKGLDMQIPSSSVVSRQSYDAATLAGPLSNQMAALKAAGAQVVVLATIPAATALAMLPAALIGYFPQYVVDSVGADPPTVGPLLSSFAQKGGGTPAQVAAAGGLLNGVITTAYFAPESDTTNPWVQAEKNILQKYAPSLYAKSGLDGNTQYGVALAYTFVQALQKAGKNLTRQGLLNAINKSGKTFVTPGFVPLSYSSSVHYGFLGEEVLKLESSAPPAVTPTGSWIGGVAVSPVVVTSPGKGPIHKYTGPTSVPPKSLTSGS
jgi:ABC-type branched-subunit amino acid transport system substrate-binding protein